MNKFTLLLLSIALLPAVNYAASSQLKCKGTSNDFYIYGTTPNNGDTYTIEVQKGGSSLQYTSTCVGSTCSNVSKDESIYFNDDLDNRVYTVTFSNRQNASTGTLHALPETVKIVKDPNGIQAEYKAIYYGTDPDSKATPKAFVKKPIRLDCQLTRAGTTTSTLAAKP